MLVIRVINSKANLAVEGEDVLETCPKLVIYFGKPKNHQEKQRDETKSVVWIIDLI
jgi:hypothetical protein